jgi:hypothetical protein
MQLRHLLSLLLVSGLTVGCAGTSRTRAVSPAPKIAAEPARRIMFLPPPLTDDWSKWIAGEWEGSGESDAGKGRGSSRFELTLSGQFLIQRGEAAIGEINPEYLKKHMHASEEEIERFKRSGYQSLEIYTIDQETGEVIGFLFDNLRCMAKGRGKREGYKEIMEWEWAAGHRSTRITERVGDDKLVVTERTRNADGSIMEDKGEMTRRKLQPATQKR